MPPPWASFHPFSASSSASPGPSFLEFPPLTPTLAATQIPDPCAHSPLSDLRGCRHFKQCGTSVSGVRPCPSTGGVSGAGQRPTGTVLGSDPFSSSQQPPEARLITAVTQRSKTEAQRGQVICPWSPSWQVMKPRFNCETAQPSAARRRPGPGAWRVHCGPLVGVRNCRDPLSWCGRRWGLTLLLDTQRGAWFLSRAPGAAGP